MPKEEVSQLLASAAHKLTAASHLVLWADAGVRALAKEEIEGAQKLVAMATELAGKEVL